LKSHTGKLSTVIVWFVKFAFKRDDKCAWKLSDTGTLFYIANSEYSTHSFISCEFTMSVVLCALCTGTPCLMQ